MSRRTIALVVLPAAALPLVLVLLHHYAVPLGEGSFIYRYSPLWALRLLHTSLALPGIALVFLAVRSAAPDRLGSRSAIYATGGFIYLAVFTYFAPPSALRQHYLNLLSPSHEGAFIIETRAATTATAYVAKFPSRQALSIDELNGTRVLSNPPGTTLLVYFIRDSWPPGPIEDYLRDETGQSGELISLSALALKLSAMLTSLWILAAVPLYHAARLLGLAPATALSAAAIAIFSPSALHFSPGKDPAQLLLAATQLFAAALALSSHSSLRRLATGSALLAATTALAAAFSLLLLWTGLAAATFLLLSTLRTPTPPTLVHRLTTILLFALAGLAATYLALRLTVGMDLVTTTLSVARRFAEVQPQIKLDLLTWRLIGFPLFLLFLPPALFTLPLLALSRHHPHRSYLLLVTTLAVMFLTYLLGVPYELPRLWIIFLPALTLGLFAFLSPPTPDTTPAPLPPDTTPTPLPPDTTPDTSPENATSLTPHLLALLTAASLLSTTLHWTQLDPRESEYRLTTGRNFN